MKLTHITNILLVTTAVLTTNMAQARSAEVYDTIDPQLLLNLARGEGRADLIQTQGKDPVINGRINGIDYQLYFTECQNNANCTTLEFLLQINANKKKPFKLETVNRLNLEYKGLTSYLDMNKNLIVARTLYFSGGLTQTHIEQFLQLNRLIIEALQAENLYK